MRSQPRAVAPNQRSVDEIQREGDLPEVLRHAAVEHGLQERVVVDDGDEADGAQRDPKVRGSVEVRDEAEEGFEERVFAQGLSEFGDAEGVHAEENTENGGDASGERGVVELGPSITEDVASGLFPPDPVVVVVDVVGAAREFRACLVSESQVGANIGQGHAAEEEEDVGLGSVEEIGDKDEVEGHAHKGPEPMRDGEQGENHHRRSKLDGKSPQVRVVGVDVAAVDGIPDGVGQRHAVFGPVGELPIKSVGVRRDSGALRNGLGPRFGGEEAQIGHDGTHEQHERRGHEQARVASE